MNRREWARIVGAGAAGLALGCGDNQPVRTAAAAILEPTTDSLLVVVWARRGGIARVDVHSNLLLIARESVDLGTGSGAVDIRGLAAGTSYLVTVAMPTGISLGPFVARTAPRDDDARPVRLAVSADVDPDPQFDSAMLESLIATEPELYVSIGDFPYCDNGPVAQTLDDYRDRHVALRTTPRVRALHEAVAMRAIYDDHEFHNDWDPHFVSEEPVRYAAALQSWDEFFPLRDPVGEIRYRRWRWGANVECFLLDCRRFRSANAAPDDASKTMLGAIQREWLISGVTTSTATFKLVFTSVPLDFGNGVDHWSGFTTERDAIFAALVGTPGIVFLSGDQHWFGAHRHAHGIREFQVGPLARGLGEPGIAPAGVLFRAARYNAGVLDITSDTLVVTGLGADGEAFYTETLTADALTPR